MDNIKKVQDSEKMSEESRVVSDRDRARLRLEESVKELTAARGQEDNVIDKLIVKVNEAFDVLLDSHVELVLSLGENLSDETHENFLYEASDERDKAVEEAEEEKEKAKKIAREKVIINESFEVDNLGLLGSKDRKESFNRKLMISCKVSQEVAREGLFQMFSMGSISKVLLSIATLQGEFGPQEVSRIFEHVDNKLKHVEQQYGSPQQIKDIAKLKFSGVVYLKKGTVDINLSIHDHDIGDAVLLKKLDKPPDTRVRGGIFQSMLGVEQLFGSLLQVKSIIKYKLSESAYVRKNVRDIARGVTYNAGKKLLGNMSKAPDIAVKVHREVEATAADESHVTGEKLVNNFIPFNPVEFYDTWENFVDKFVPSGSIEFYVTGEKLVNKSGVEAQKEIKLFSGGGEAVGISNTSEAFPSSINESNSKSTRLEKSEEINFLFKHVDNECKLEQMCDNTIPSKSFFKLNFLFKHGDDILELEQQFGGLLQARGFAKLKLSDFACVKRRSGSIGLSDKSAMADQLGYVNGKLAEYIRGAKHPTQHKSDTFEKEQQFLGRRQARDFTNSLQQDRDPARLNLSGLTYVRKSVEDIGLDITYDPGERLFVNKPWSKSFARLKLTGTIYLERRAGGITLIVRAEFNRKGIGDSSLFERSIFIARSSVDTGPVFKDNKLKVPETNRLKEENSQK